MRRFHHQRLPDHSTLHSGRQPPDEVGFQSDRLQIWFNHTERSWEDPGTVGMHPPLETLMIRAPSVDDKRFLP